jgi:hypothetical protein
MPKLREVIGRNKTKIHCHGTMYRRCVLAALRIVKLDLTEVGIEAKSLQYSGKEKVVFRTNFEQIFKRTATDLETADNDRAEIDVRANNSRLLLPQRYG